ncbi:methyltransferase [Catenovulum agarivorans DS-2]|uniref:Methyltransferase n=1 Tax=Catenovulum agarivorans DS-2 TaxID=1328313 RepID=W7QNK6_9ALTE|nr:methyltransferase domain-containing protein [Catenovulum agarivorans]EWH09498.1 methyltransferase [Catenovulum agarivorans DS-2]
MKTDWNYTGMAKAYLKRPDYADEALHKLFELTGVKPNEKVCDVGAGVAHLTLKLADQGLNVTAVEPNDDMRGEGIQRTKAYPNVEWFEGIGENTKQNSDTFSLVTFGSSFNVCDRQAALLESKRILVNNGWFAAMWNHRDLNDPIQAEIESIIKKYIPKYGYGTRREDQTDEIDRSNLFNPVHFLTGNIVHQQHKDDVIEAWRSHATLERQAKESFPNIIKDISLMLTNISNETIEVPYTTRIWAAQLK